MAVIMRPALLLLLVLPGCFWVTTKSEGNGIRKDVRDLQGRIAKQEETVDAKVKQLDESLDKATALLKRNSADVGAQVDQLTKDAERSRQALEEMQAQIAAMQAQVDQARADLEKARLAAEQRLAAAEARVDALEKGATKPVKPDPPKTADREAMWTAAKGRFDAGQLTDARTELRAYLKAFPKDDRADDAQFYVGETFFKEKQFEKAIAEYQKVIENYPDTADFVDDAFYAAGLASIELKWCVDAGAYLGEMLKRYPKSPLAKPAKTKLDFVKKNSKNKSVCQG